MQPYLTLTVYCLLIASAALLGGWLPMLLRMTHTGMQLSMSFIGGTMLGVGILHLLPHSFFELREIYPCVWWMMAGFLTMFFIERVFHFHHHDVPGEHDHGAGHSHHAGHDHAGHDHAHPHAHHGDSHAHEATSTRPRGWQAALVGLALHSAADGMALAASVAAEPDGGLLTASGLAVFLVIFLHKPFDSLTLGTLMAVSGKSMATRHLVNVLYATAVPIGVTLFLFGVGHSDAPERLVLGAALAFSAGTFLCISTSDLLPELQFHAHDRLKLSAALILGLSVAAGIVLVESSTHKHGGSHPHRAVEEHGDESHGHDHAADDHHDHDHHAQ